MDKKKRLLEILKKKSVSYGNFTLSSGKKSYYYVDSKLSTYDPEGIILAGQIMYEMVKNSDVTAIGGLTMGADPLVISSIMAGYTDDRMIKGFSVRKEAKSHGKKKLIEGNLDISDKVVVIDDVITTGSSTMKAIEAVEEFGAKIITIISLVDRQEGGKEKIGERGYFVNSIFTIDELIDLNEIERIKNNAKPTTFTISNKERFLST